MDQANIISDNLVDDGVQKGGYLTAQPFQRDGFLNVGSPRDTDRASFRSPRERQNHDLAHKYARIEDPNEFYSIFKEENNFASHQLLNIRQAKKLGVKSLEEMACSGPSYLIQQMQTNRYPKAFEKTKQSLEKGQSKHSVKTRKGSNTHRGKHTNNTFSVHQIKDKKFGPKVQQWQTEFQSMGNSKTYIPTTVPSMQHSKQSSIRKRPEHLPSNKPFLYSSSSSGPSQILQSMQFQNQINDHAARNYGGASVPAGLPGQLPTMVQDTSLNKGAVNQYHFI